MEAKKGIMEALASLNRIGDGWAANNESVPLNTIKILQFLELTHESIFVLLSYLRPELEHDCAVGQCSILQASIRIERREVTDPCE